MPISTRPHLAVVPCLASLALLVACGGGETGGGGGAGGHGDTTPSGSSTSNTSTSTSASGSGSASTSSTSGSTSTSSTSSSGGGAVDCKNLPICDDFEAATAGAEPGGKWKIIIPNGTTSPSTVAIDGTLAHSGTKSVKVTGKGGYSNHIFFGNQDLVAGIGKVVFGRFFLRLSNPFADGHTTFMAMKDTGDGGKDLRMGGQAQILMWNREQGDPTLPSLSPVGISKSIKPPTNQWLCVEFMIDGNQSASQTWVDGTEIEGLHVDGTPTPDIDQQWLNSAWKPSLTDWKLGWESYAGGDMTLWFDDVALGPQRIGCQ